MFGADIQHFGKLCRRISIENKMNHCFFIGLDEGTKNILRCSFVDPNIEQLPCFAHSQAMMSLEGEKNIALALHVVAHFLMVGPNSLGGQGRT